ncbi:MAG: hypothetical protein QF903_01985 [Planctomycetota bacterium]|jgi:hypothetical protein|nr:hypothetical protein [Planctomycetota bacterium]MDP6764140.1 hypothetical protein [Planctomycetota bacterium]MDP6988234.1 hypothetical protein [Planctomycetota bacterium]
MRSRIATAAAVVTSVLVVFGMLAHVDARKSPPSSGQMPAELVQVQVLTDRLDPVALATLRVTNGANVSVATTNADGHTTCFTNMDPDIDGIELSIQERTTPDGIALGMLEQVYPPHIPDNGQDVHLSVISQTVPLAVPVQIQGEGESTCIFPPDGYETYWTFSTAAGSGLAFNANVATILDREDVSRYFAYHGHNSTEDYARGAVMVVPDLQLGNSGFGMGIWLMGAYDYGNDGVAVDAYNFTNNSNGPAMDPVVVETMIVQNDMVYVRVMGEVAGGHLAFFVRSFDGNPSQSYRFDDNPPTFPPFRDVRDTTDFVMTDCIGCRDDERVAATATSPPTTPTSFVQDCEPDAPDMPDGWSCAPPTGTPNHCGAVTSAGETQCTVIRMRGPRTCRTDGNTYTVSRGRVAAWKVSFEFGGGPEGSPLTSESGFEYGERTTVVETDEWTADAGLYGLGQCMRYFRFELTCAAPWFKKFGLWEYRVEGGPQFDPCGETRVVWTKCRDTSTSQAVCDRTP